MEKIIVEGKEISIRLVDKQDYISLTDIAKTHPAGTKPADLVRAWINTGTTLIFLETWEQMYNPDFKVDSTVHFKAKVGE